MKLLITSVILFLVVSPLTQAKHNNRYTIKAKVIEFSPVYKYVRVSQPHFDCEPKVVSKISYRVNDKGAAVVGGIVGGFIGHAASNDKHKGLGTIMGAVIGSSLAHNIERHNRRNFHTQSQNCVLTNNTTRKERVLEGYHVTYRSHGKLYRRFMQNKPGRYIQI